MSRWINPLKSEEVWKPHYPKRVPRTHETRLCVESEEPFEVPTGKDDKMLVKVSGIVEMKDAAEVLLPRLKSQIKRGNWQIHRD